jgi:hypothetical protein
MAHPYAEVEKAILGLREAFVEAERRNTWSWIADEFYAPHCVYTCPYGGTIAVVANGREEIRRTHYGRDMDVGSGWAGWSFPILNYAINGDFVMTCSTSPIRCGYATSWRMPACCIRISSETGSSR